MAQPSIVPQHVAIIMDGNGRWAKSRGLPRLEGHRAGVKTVRTIVQEARRLGVRYLTLYTFSSENWRRPLDEVSGLMSLLARHLDSELQLMLENDIRLRALGDLDKLPGAVRKTLEGNMQRTQSGSGMDLILALSYGSRDEIVAAARKLADRAKRGDISPDAIDEKAFAAALYAPDVPDPELLIRTSNEFRISNFLLWQIAYAELVITPVFWPDFSIEEFHRCLGEYAGRERRFGLTAEQLPK